jgi:hypothetical protein
MLRNEHHPSRMQIAFLISNMGVDGSFLDKHDFILFKTLVGRDGVAGAPARREDRQSRHGTGRCAVEHRAIDWASRSPSRGVRTRNHDRSCDRRDAWVESKISDLQLITTPALVGDWWGFEPFSARAKWRSSTSACGGVLEKVLDSADIVRDAA